MMNKILCLLFSVLLLMGMMAGCKPTPTPTPEPDSSVDSSVTSSLPSDDNSTTTTTTDSTTTSTTVTTTVTVPVVQSVPVTTEKTFELLPAEKSVLLNKNPDRGYRSEMIVDIPAADDAESFAKWTDEAVLDRVRKDIPGNALDESVMVSRLYFYLAEYTTMETIPEQAIELIRKYMKAHMEMGVKMYLVFYYQRSDNKCPNTDIILKHMDQFNKLIHEFKDGIAALCFGLIGRYGEWTSASHVDEYDRKTITDKMISMIPSTMYLNMRSPQLKWNNVSKDNPRYKTIGFDDAAVFGMETTHGTWVPGSEEWTGGMKEAPYAFNDAELFTTNYFRNNGVYVKGLSVIESLSQHRTQTLSAWHGYGDYASNGGTIQESTFYGWKCEEVTAEWLEKKGLPYSPSWFTRANGDTVQRNVFEYLRDYLGYHLSMTDLQVTGGTKAGNTINVKANLVNYGMGAAMNLESGFAILDEAGNVVSTTMVGNPAEWHSTNPEDYSDRKLLNHGLETSMTLPKEKGTYQLAFFVRNAMGQYARLDNAIPYVNGYNSLHMFTID